MYEKLAGMTGTAKTENKFEPYTIWKLSYSTHKTMISDRMIWSRNVEEKYKAIVAEIKARMKKVSLFLLERHHRKE